MSTISASTTLTTAYSVTGDTTGTLVLKTGASPTTAVTIGSDQSVTFAGAVTTSGNQTVTGNLTINGNTTVGDASTDTATVNATTTFAAYPNLPNTFGFKNRIINGAMMIDQRNAGAAVTTSSSYPVDRFLVFNLTDGAFSAQRDTVAPVGFTNSLKWTTTTADASLSADQRCGLIQAIEGFNTADLGWGTANAQAVTVSFWVRSSLTGTFGGSLRNSGASRSYIFSYTISAANTWEYKTVTVAGDTTGTWLTDNSAGIQLGWSFGAGSNFQGTAGAWQSGNLQNFSGGASVIGTLNATWYVTGVQLEKGSTATSFDYRPYGTELALCQRYYEKSFSLSVAPQNGASTTALADDGNSIHTYSFGTTGADGAYVKFTVPKRATPSTLTIYGNSAGKMLASGGGTATSLNAALDSTLSALGENCFSVYQSTVGGTIIVGFRFHYAANAEL